MQLKCYIKALEAFANIHARLLMITNVDGNCKIGRGFESKPNLALSFHRISNLCRDRKITWLLEAISNVACSLKNWLNVTRKSKCESDIIHNGNLWPSLQSVSNVWHVRSIAPYITIPCNPLENLRPCKTLEGLKIEDRVWWHSALSLHYCKSEFTLSGKPRSSRPFCIFSRHFPRSSETHIGYIRFRFSSWA